MLSKVAAAIAISGRVELYGFTMPGPTKIFEVDCAMAPHRGQALSHRRSWAIQTAWKPSFSLNEASEEMAVGEPEELVNEISKSKEHESWCFVF
jgi:hypothetical protein